MVGELDDDDDDDTPLRCFAATRPNVTNVTSVIRITSNRTCRHMLSLSGCAHVRACVWNKQVLVPAEPAWL